MTTRRRDNAKVGYRRPPKHSQFRPGQSGNPRGRPKGGRADLDFARLLLAALNKKIVGIGNDGRRQSLTKLDAMISNTVNAGVKGDLKAAAKVFEWLIRLPVPDINPRDPVPDYAAEVRAKLEAYAKAVREQDPTLADPEPEEEQ